MKAEGSTHTHRKRTPKTQHWGGHALLRHATPLVFPNSFNTQDASQKWQPSMRIDISAIQQRTGVGQPYVAMIWFFCSVDSSVRGWTRLIRQPRPSGQSVQGRRNNPWTSTTASGNPGPLLKLASRGIRIGRSICTFDRGGSHLFRVHHQQRCTVSVLHCLLSVHPCADSHHG